MKNCSKCGHAKEHGYFTKDRGQTDGLYPSCKTCKKLLYLLKAAQISKQNSHYQCLNKKKVAEYQASYRKEKLKTNLNYKLTLQLRCRLNSALKHHKPNGSHIADLGCSIEELKLYLESKFQPEMTWDNHTRYGWHIDHIVPLSSFNLSLRDEVKKACHFTNLQPLWWRDNLVKSNRMEIL